MNAEPPTGRPGFRAPSVWSHPLWTYAFRPFFLLAGLFAVAAMGHWLLVLRGLPWPASGAFSTVWHAHEMTLGFAMAVVAGFLLTAVATWTGRRPVQGPLLAVLVLAWLAGRLVMWLGTGLPAAMVAVADLAFPVLVAVLVTREVVAARNRRNYPIALLAWLFAALTAFYQGAALGWIPEDTEAVTEQMAVNLLLQMLVLLVTVIGGRVVPSFTGNWLRMRAGLPAGGSPAPMPVVRPWLEPVVIILTAAAGVGWSLVPGSPVAALLCLGAGLAQALRLSGWRGFTTWPEPLLFVLHAAYAALPAGFLLLGAAGLGLPLPATAALHTLAVGAVGGMILAMMSRVALGHTGRPLRAAPVTVMAYVLLGLAAVLRVAGPVLPALAVLSLDLSGLLWMLSFALFVWHYGPILTGPRAPSP
jgi:uncharacterized protein involved in response to NO